MFEWFKSLTEAPKVALLGAVIGAVVTLIIAFFTILVKDYYIPILAERREALKLKKNAFKKYAYPIILASSSLLFRLDEIFNQRGGYLLDSTPKTPFNNYKYVSTVYRLCVLMGWMRASNIEYAHIEVKNTKEYQNVRDAVFGLEIALADGQHVERRVLMKLCELAGLNTSTLNEQIKGVLGSKVEEWIESFCHKNQATSAFSLAVDKKPLLVQYVINELCGCMSMPPKDAAFFSAKMIKDCIENMDWKEGLIYRDWQSAIGDLVIKSNPGSERKYDVVGYKEFEELYDSSDLSIKKWIHRSEKLFKNLDIVNPPVFDVRHEQLSRVFVATYQLLLINAKLTDAKVKVAEDTLHRFFKTYESLKPPHIQKKRRRGVFGFNGRSFRALAPASNFR